MNIVVSDRFIGDFRNLNSKRREEFLLILEEINSASIEDITSNSYKKVDGIIEYKKKKFTINCILQEAPESLLYLTNFSVEKYHDNENTGQIILYKWIIPIILVFCMFLIGLSLSKRYGNGIIAIEFRNTKINYSKLFSIRAIEYSNSRLIDPFMAIFSDTIRTFYLDKNVPKEEAKYLTLWYWNKFPNSQVVIDTSFIATSQVADSTIVLMKCTHFGAPRDPIVYFSEMVFLNNRIVSIQDYFNQMNSKIAKQVK